jgi:uncharacterized repeat protein (TIGR02543 family)
MIQKPTFFNLASDRVAESFGSFSVYLFDGELYGSRQAYRHMAARRQVSDRSSESFDEYEIQYFLNGGVQSGANPLKYKKEDLPVSLYSPSREGYNFSGWYLDSSFTKKISRITQGQAGRFTAIINVPAQRKRLGATKRPSRRNGLKILWWSRQWPL